MRRQNNMSEPTIINLASGEPVTQIKEQDHDIGYCMSRCQNVLVDIHLRQLTCRECRAVVDPWVWVVRMAQEESHLVRRIEALKQEHSNHSKRVEELKAEEQRIKARIRGAKDSLLRSAGI